jgi:hypothetical protein
MSTFSQLPMNLYRLAITEGQMGSFMVVEPNGSR